MSAAEGVVLATRRGPAVWIAINRPERRNALNAEVLDAMRTHVERACQDTALRAIVITGTGDKAFCAGADLTQGTGVFSETVDDPTTDFGRLARCVREVGVPLIARINGACVAGGMGLMALCDLAVSAEHCKFGLPEAKVGVFPMQVLVYLRRMIAPRHLNELCLCGDLIDARRACDIGLVNDVVPSAQLDDSIDALVARISSCSPVALRRGKAAIAAMETMAFAEALSYAEAQIALTARSADAREGLAAFVEKRKPAWSIGDADGNSRSD